eukprot:588080-Pyramimonas_sp.AAC.1
MVGAVVVVAVVVVVVVFVHVAVGANIAAVVVLVVLVVIIPQYICNDKRATIGHAMFDMHASPRKVSALESERPARHTMGKSRLRP